MSADPVSQKPYILKGYFFFHLGYISVDHYYLYNTDWTQSNTREDPKSRPQVHSASSWDLVRIRFLEICIHSAFTRSPLNISEIQSYVLVFQSVFHYFLTLFCLFVCNWWFNIVLNSFFFKIFSLINTNIDQWFSINYAVRIQNRKNQWFRNY